MSATLKETVGPWIQLVPGLFLFEWLLAGTECYEELFVNINLQSTKCVGLLISKLLSLGIVASSAIVKIPQILIIVRSSSAEGLSLASTLLGLLCFITSVAYNYRSEYPFTTYGETTFITVQDVIIAALILFYGNGKKGDSNPLAAILLLLSVTAFSYFIIFTNILPMDVLLVGQTLTIPALAISRVPQLYTNFVNKSTGNLSSVAVFMFALGSIARIFTTLQEVADPVILSGFLLGTAMNIALAAQMIYYWGKKPISQLKDKKKQ